LLVATHFLLENSRNRHKIGRGRYRRQGLATRRESYRHCGLVVDGRKDILVGCLVAFAEAVGVGLRLDAVLAVAGD
jgi:hypothetical protein